MSTITEETNLFKQAAETVKTLHAENVALREENRRLKRLRGAAIDAISEVWKALGVTGHVGRAIWEEVAALRLENEHLKQHVRDLDHDLETAAKSELDDLNWREAVGER